jgi:Domain of unknown function (DUF4340)
MNPKNTWILIAVTVGLFAFIFFFERHHNDATPTAAKLLPGLEATSVANIQIQPAGIRAERTNGTWQLTKPITYPAQAETIEKLLQALESLTVQTHIPAQELRKHPKADEEFGFETPQVTLMIERHQLRFGFLTAPGDQVYVQVVGSTGIDIVSSDILKFIPRNLNEWRDPGFLSLKGLAFDRLSVTNGGRAFELHRESNQTWRVTYPMPARADGMKVEEALARLGNLQVNRFVSDESQADLDTYGLQPPEVEVAFSQGTNALFSLQFGKSPTNGTNRVFAKIKGRPTVVEIPKEPVSIWRARYEEFRDRRLAGKIPPSLSIIEVHGQDKSQDFTVQKANDGTWQVKEPYNFTADPETMREFINGLGSLEIVPGPGQFAVKDVVSASDFPKYGLANPVRSYVLKEGKDSSKSTNAVIAALDFGSTIEDKIYARRTDRPDEDSVYAVKQADFDALASKAFQLRQRHIWNFSPTNVSSITVRQNGTTVKMLRKAENQWTFASGSQGLLDNFAVEAGAEELGSLEAGAWVDRGDQNLAKYGFNDKSPQVLVEVHSGGQDQTLTLDLGSMSSAQHRYGAVQMGGQTWIFEFPIRTAERIAYDFGIREKSTP